jgi:hypothetical protein
LKNIAVVWVAWNAITLCTPVLAVLHKCLMSFPKVKNAWPVTALKTFGQCLLTMSYAPAIAASSAIALRRDSNDLLAAAVSEDVWLYTGRTGRLLLSTRWTVALEQT